ncbi:hypothetical protein L7F22_033504 [Adiantum nelumboides]|nr:hypothetical protein [Adiantum nelumboides]
MANACMLSRAVPGLSGPSHFTVEKPASLPASLTPASSFVGAAIHNLPLQGPSSRSSSPYLFSLSIRCNATIRPQYIPNRIDDPHYVRIFDTTLRDGEQSPGATLTSKEKLDIAKQLAKLGVDIIEAGFPIASPDDLEAVKLIAREVGNDVNGDGYVPVICGLARCNKVDIDAAWQGVKQALRPRIHTFIATSEIHMQYKLRKSPDEVVKIARDMVAYARSLGCEDVEFSPEDAGRSDHEFLYRILEEVIRAGATTLNIPDTVGYTLPEEFGQLIAKIKANTKGADKVIISTHCQNDLGLATANTLAGAANGARQVEVTLNGIGERAGNASLEELHIMVMDLLAVTHRYFIKVFTLGIIAEPGWTAGRDTVHAWLEVYLRLGVSQEVPYYSQDDFYMGRQGRVYNKSSTSTDEASTIMVYSILYLRASRFAGTLESYLFYDGHDMSSVHMYRFCTYLAAYSSAGVTSISAGPPFPDFCSEWALRREGFQLSLSLVNVYAGHYFQSPPGKVCISFQL